MICTMFSLLLLWLITVTFNQNNNNVISHPINSDGSSQTLLSSSKHSCRIFSFGRKCVLFSCMLFLLALMVIVIGETTYIIKLKHDLRHKTNLVDTCQNKINQTMKFLSDKSYGQLQSAVLDDESEMIELNRQKSTRDDH